MIASRFGSATRPTRRRVFRSTAVTLILFAAACGGETKAADEASAAPDGPRSGVEFTKALVQSGGVRWAPVQTGQMAASIEVPGQIMPNGDRTARLGAPAQGRVLTVHVQPGDGVARGQPLVTLVSQQASAAHAEYEKARAELNSRRAAATYARTARERAERLLAAKATSRQELERAQADDELARAELEQAESELARTRSTVSQLGVGSTAGTMVLRAPLAGVVLSRDTEPGAVVEAGAPLVTVADTRTLWLEAAVSDRAAGALRPGAGVRFTVPAFPADTFVATVQNVGSGLDPDTRTLPVRARVENADGRLRPQMFATVWIDGGDPRQAVVVPDGAVQLLDRRPVVFVAIPNGTGGARFERRDVELGASAGGQTQILRGVSPGDVVVTDGAFAVKSVFARAQMEEG